MKGMVAFLKAFPDIKWEPGNWVVSQGDTVVCEIIESGTFTGPWSFSFGSGHDVAPTNRSYRSTIAVLFRVTPSGLIAEYLIYGNPLDWLHQIGVDPNVAIPPPPPPPAAG